MSAWKAAWVVELRHAVVVVVVVRKGRTKDSPCYTIAGEAELWSQLKECCWYEPCEGEQWSFSESAHRQWQEEGWAAGSLHPVCTFGLLFPRVCPSLFPESLLCWRVSISEGTDVAVAYLLKRLLWILTVGRLHRSRRRERASCQLRSGAAANMWLKHAEQLSTLRFL